MHCDRVRGELNAYVDGQLTDALTNLIDDHVSSCAGCAARVERMRRLEDLLNEPAFASVPEGFAARVLGSARRQMRRMPATTHTMALAMLPRERRASPRAAAAAVLAAGFSLGTWMATETWLLGDIEPNVPALATRSAPDIGTFYGAESDDLDAQRPLLQIYLSLVDRTTSGE